MMNKNSESFNIARHQYIKGYQDKNEHIFPTLNPGDGSIAILCK